MSSEAFDSWAVLELMGHVRMAGRVTEEERFGVKMGRIDVPKVIDDCTECSGRGCHTDKERYGVTCITCDGEGCFYGFTTVYFGGESVYRMTPTTKGVACHVAKKCQPEPVHRWELPSPEKAAQAFDARPDLDDYEKDADPCDDSEDLEF